jgi:hypothetical protein
MKSPLRYAVVVSYACRLGERGTVLSRHITYTAARISARRSGFDEFLRIDDIHSDPAPALLPPVNRPNHA